MSVFLRKDRGDTYYYEFRIGPVRFAGSTGEKSRRDAERVERQKYAEAQAQIAAGYLKDDRPTVAGICAKFWDEHGKRLAMKQTLQGYLLSITDIVGGHRAYAEVGSKDVSDFIVARRALGKRVWKNVETPNGTELQLVRVGEVSDTTIAATLAMWKSMHRMCTRWEVATKPIDWSQFKLEKRAPVVRAYTQEQFKRFASHLPAHIGRCVWFLLATGVRSSIMFTLTWGQVDLVRREITVRALKKRGAVAYQTIPLNDTALMAFEELAPGADDQLVFNTTNFRKIVEAAQAREGLSDFRPAHDLRHTFATWLGEAGAPIEVVSKLLGHSSIAVTMKYRHVFEREQRAAANLLPNPVHKTPPVGTNQAQPITLNPLKTLKKLG